MRIIENVKWDRVSSITSVISLLFFIFTVFLATCEFRRDQNIQKIDSALRYLDRFHDSDFVERSQFLGDMIRGGNMNPSTDISKAFPLLDYIDNVALCVESGVCDRKTILSSMTSDRIMLIRICPQIMHIRNKVDKNYMQNSFELFELENHC